MVWSDYDTTMLALTAWREARGEGADGMRAVMHVIRNRASDMLHPQTIGDVCSKPYQFSSMTAKNDPELILWPQSRDAAFIVAMGLVSGILNGVDPDITCGATFYFAPAVVRPAWADKMKLVATIGHHEFYKP